MLDEQAKWNIFLGIVYAAALWWAVNSLWQNNHLPIAISTFDFILLSLATFRVTRLFVYDHIMEWFRNLFLDQVQYDDGTHEILKPEQGIRRTIATLLHCPWCLAMWSALPLAYLYFITPFFWFPLLVLAVSGLGTFIQITMSAIGWSAERQKAKVFRGE